MKSFFGNIYRYIFRGPIFWWFTRSVPFWKPIYYTRHHQSNITFGYWFFQKFLGFNKRSYWPMHFTSVVRFPKNIYVGIDAAPGRQPGCYIQAIGKIYIDDYTQIAANVGLISSNHFMLDIREHIKDEIRIGKYCRIGIGSTILPGVVLGDFTTVAAGSIVSKSFSNGYCVISGNPAHLVVDYSQNEGIKEKFVRYEYDNPYNGYIPHSKFEEFRKKNLNV